MKIGFKEINKIYSLKILGKPCLLFGSFIFKIQILLLSVSILIVICQLGFGRDVQKPKTS